jgi:hypothetical protein
MEREKKITTKVKFSNEEVRDILLREAGAPADVKYGELRDDDGDSVYLDFEVLWEETSK